MGKCFPIADVLDEVEGGSVIKAVEVADSLGRVYYANGINVVDMEEHILLITSTAHTNT